MPPAHHGEVEGGFQAGQVHIKTGKTALIARLVVNPTTTRSRSRWIETTIYRQHVSQLSTNHCSYIYSLILRT